jgi:hypothetical protein
MLWPMQATRQPENASRTLPRSSTSFVGVASSKRPSEAPFPENENCMTAISLAVSATARSLAHGRSLCPVTPWRMTATSWRPGRPAANV